MISVLVPTDFSENAYHALRYAVSMSNGNNLHIILLNTYQMLPSTTEMFISIDDILQKNSEKGLQKEIDEIKREYSHKNFSYDLISLYGTLKNGIRQVINSKKVDMVVMGTTGANGLQKLFMGSNASDIIKNIGKPVVIIPDKDDIKHFDNIVLAVDYKDEIDSQMMESLKVLARMHGSFINIVSIVPRGKLDSLTKSTNKEMVCKELKEFPHSYDLIEGDNVVDAINTFAKQKKANMLAVIPHKLGLFENFFHKSVSKELVMRAEIPMMAMH
jgi:nucleotide-binding universal stress UspA family protein